MEDRLRRYVDGLFARTAPTKKAVELKEEMLQNLNDKYSDLIAEGKSPEAAYNIAIAGIGDVSGLLMELEAEAAYEMPDMAEYETIRRKHAMLTSLAVVIYILSPLPLIFLAIVGYGGATRIGLSALFVMVAAATGMLVWNSMMKPRFISNPDTMVDEFRKWQSGSHDEKSLRKAISSALWTVLVALYFVVSFWTGAWHITWIMFLLGAAAEALINVFVTLKK